MQSEIYLITGITGYIGSLLTKFLLEQTEYSIGQIKIIGITRSVEKAKDMFENRDCSGLTFVQADICDAEMLGTQIKAPIDYIIHCAAATTSSYMIARPVETADGIVLGTKNLLEFARRKGVKEFVYLSSMEAYGNVADIGRPRMEEELGDVPLDSPRSCYPLGKRMAEHYCHIYYKEYGVPTKIARLAQAFGVGVRPEDNRVYMQFARAAYEKRDIILKTQGLSVGNYCASDDVVDAVFCILKKGVAGETYNVVNEENTMCIRDMAQLVATEIARDEIVVKIEAEDSAKTGYAPDTALRMSGEKLRTLGWKPTKNLVQMYRDVLLELTNI